MIYLLIIRFVLGCETMCEEACSVLNGPGSCYKDCGCEEREAVAVDWRLKENLKEVLGKVLNDTDCLIERYEKCLGLGRERMKKCIVKANCEALVDFFYLTREIPVVLWMAISPPVLVKYFDKDQGISYKNLDLCQRACTKNEIGQGPKAFEKFEICIEDCEEQFNKDFDASCSYNCFMKCLGKGDDCLESCLSKDCGITQGTKTGKKAGGFKLKHYNKPKEDL